MGRTSQANRNHRESSQVKFITPYTHTDARSERFATKNEQPSLTQQSDAAETDINLIMSRYQQTGQLPQRLTQPLFGDFTTVPDYRQAVEAINAANEAFMQIPAKIRGQFGNDPAEFIKFASNPENKEELQKMGLLAEAPQPTLAEQTLTAIKDLKPKEQPNGTGQK